MKRGLLEREGAKIVSIAKFPFLLTVSNLIILFRPTAEYSDPSQRKMGDVADVKCGDFLN
jgi:hypothetical protein